MIARELIQWSFARDLGSQVAQCANMKASEEQIDFNFAGIAVEKSFRTTRD